MLKLAIFVSTCVIIVTVNCKFIPRPQTGSRRTGADILTATGEKVPIEIKDADKLSPNVGILGVQIHDDPKKDAKKESEKEKQEVEEKVKKPIESDEEKLEKMQLGYHVPGNIVKEGSTEFDPNLYQLQQPQGGYPTMGDYGGWGMGGGYPQLYAGRR